MQRGGRVAHAEQKNGVSWHLFKHCTSSFTFKSSAEVWEIDLESMGEPSLGNLL